MSLPSIQIVHYNITVASGLKWHGYLMCHTPEVQMKNTCKNLTFSVFHPYFFTFPKFSLYSNVSSIGVTLIHSIKYTVSVIVSELYQYILLWAFQVYKLFIITLQLRQAWSGMATWCVTHLGANEKYLQKINLFCFHPYFFTFPKFSLYSNINGIE